MKKIAILLLPAFLFISGCNEPSIKYDIPNPPITSGFLVSKNFIPSASHKGLTVLSLYDSGKKTSHDYNVMVKSPEMFVITIETKELTVNGNSIHHRSYYQVNATIFGELQLGTIVDVKGNPNIKNVEVW